MVDFDRVIGEVKRTAYTGLGTFGSATVGNLLDEYVPGDNVAVAGSQMALGAGAAYVVDDRMNVRRTSGTDLEVDEAVYFASHGVGAAGFAELADILTEGSSTAQSNMVEVREVDRSRSNVSQTGSTRDEISVDV